MVTDELAAARDDIIRPIGWGGTRSPFSGLDDPRVKELAAKFGKGGRYYVDEWRAIAEDDSAHDETRFTALRYLVTISFEKMQQSSQIIHEAMDNTVRALNMTPVDSAEGVIRRAVTAAFDRERKSHPDLHDNPQVT